MEAVQSIFRINKQGDPPPLASEMTVYKIMCYIIYSQCTLSPFCDALQSVEPPVRTCSVDRELFARCNLDTQNEDVPSEFQVSWLSMNTLL